MGQVHAREAFPSSGPVTSSEQEDDNQIPLDNIKAKVASVSIDGLVRTKNDVVLDTVKDLFKVHAVQS